VVRYWQALVATAALNPADDRELGFHSSWYGQHVRYWDDIATPSPFVPTYPPTYPSDPMYRNRAWFQTARASACQASIDAMVRCALVETLLESKHLILCPETTLSRPLRLYSSFTLFVTCDIDELIPANYDKTTRSYLEDVYNPTSTTIALLFSPGEADGLPVDCFDANQEVPRAEPELTSFENVLGMGSLLCIERQTPLFETRRVMERVPLLSNSTVDVESTPELWHIAEASPISHMQRPAPASVGGVFPSTLEGHRTVYRPTAVACRLQVVWMRSKLVQCAKEIMDRLSLEWGYAEAARDPPHNGPVKDLFQVLEALGSNALQCSHAGGLYQIKGQVNASGLQSSEEANICEQFVTDARPHVVPMWNGTEIYSVHTSAATVTNASVPRSFERMYERLDQAQNKTSYAKLVESDPTARLREHLALETMNSNIPVGEKNAARGAGAAADGSIPVRTFTDSLLRTGCTPNKSSLLPVGPLSGCHAAWLGLTGNRWPYTPAYTTRYTEVSPFVPPGPMFWIQTRPTAASREKVGGFPAWPAQSYKGAEVRYTTFSDSLLTSQTIIQAMRPVPPVPVLNAQSLWLLGHVREGQLRMACYGPPVHAAVMQRMGTQYIDYWRPAVSGLTSTTRPPPDPGASVWRQLPDTEANSLDVSYAPASYSVMQQSIPVNSFMNGAARKGWFPETAQDQYAGVQPGTETPAAQEQVARAWYREQVVVAPDGSTTSEWLQINGHLAGGKAMYCLPVSGLIPRVTAAANRQDLSSFPSIQALQSNRSLGAQWSAADREYFLSAQRTLFSPVLLQATEDQIWSSVGAAARVTFEEDRVWSIDTEATADTLFQDLWVSTNTSLYLRQAAQAALDSANQTIYEQSLKADGARTNAEKTLVRLRDQNDRVFVQINKTFDSIDRARQAWDAYYFGSLLGPECEWYDSWCAFHAVRIWDDVVVRVVAPDDASPGRSDRLVRLLQTILLDVLVVVLFPAAALAASCVRRFIP